MKRNDIDIYQPTRQSIAAILVLIVKFVRRIISGFWPIILLYYVKGDAGEDAWWQLAFLGIGGLSLIGSILSYFKYYFHVTDDEIIISKGILKKTNLTIPFDRVQSVDFEQTLIHQALDVVKVKIDTAGSSSSELDIDALELPIAEKLRSIVIGYQKKNAASPSVGQHTSVEEEEEEAILRVDIPALIKIGISQNHLRTAGLILAFGWAAFNELQQVAGDFLNSKIDEINVDVDDLGPDLWSVALGALILLAFFLFIAFLITLGLTVVRYYDMKVTRSKKGFKLVAGLFNRKEISAVHRKVQIVRWDYNILQKLLGLFRVNILQAASEIAAAKPRFLLPGAYEFQVNRFIHEYFPEEILRAFHSFRISPWIIYRITLFYGLVPAAVGSFIAYISGNNLLFGFALLLPLSLLWSYYYQKNWNLEINEACLKTTSGVLGRKFNLLHLYKVQSVNFSQSWFQRRRGLSNLTVHTAGGSLTIPYLDMHSAQDLKNLLLFKVEDSRKKWM